MSILAQGFQPFEIIDEPISLIMFVPLQRTAATWTVDGR